MIVIIRTDHVVVIEDEISPSIKLFVNVPTLTTTLQGKVKKNNWLARERRKLRLRVGEMMKAKERSGWFEEG